MSGTHWGPMLDIDAIKERRAAIGEADWEIGGSKLVAIKGHPGANTSTFASVQPIVFDVERGYENIILADRVEPFPAEADFIVNAPADIDALVAEIERLWAARRGEIWRST